MKRLFTLTFILLLANSSYSEPKQETKDINEIILLKEKGEKIIFAYNNQEMDFLEFMQFLHKEENRRKDFVVESKDGKRIRSSEILNALYSSKIPYEKINEVTDYALSLQDFAKKGKGDKDSPRLYRKSNKHKITMTIYGIVDRVIIDSFINKLKAEQKKNDWIRIDIIFYEKENFVETDNGWKKRSNEKEIYKTTLGKIEQKVPVDS